MVFLKRFINKRILVLVILACFAFVISLAVLNPVYYSGNFVKDEIIVDYEAQKKPGGYVKYVHPLPSNDSYCHFNYGLPDIFNFTDLDLQYSPELGAGSPYRVVYNVLQARMTEDVPAVTYATHVSANFVNYLSELVRFWDGPVSVAAFVPHQDALLVLEQILQYCYCIPEMSRVSLHFVFPKNIDKQIFHSANNNYRKPSDCNITDSSTLKTYRSTTKKIVYPVNVCRNVARSSAMTKWLMVSDAELMPSKGLASRFLKMVEASLAYTAIAPSSKTVYVVPIFEVENTENVPKTKKQLVELVANEKAVYFHRVVCLHCQKFPKVEEWLMTDPGDIVKPFTLTKREVPYDRWEPIYIGTKDEPFYSERLSWEGLQDKMLQMFEMCLMNYDYVILDGAFLVHWPGIKKIKQKNDEKWRVPFVKANSKEYDKMSKKILKRYHPNPKCKLK